MSTLPHCPFPVTPAAYEWPCHGCGALFMPVIVHYPAGPRTTRYCDDCRALNLLRVIFEEPDDEDRR